MLPSLRRSLAFKVLLSIWGLSLSPPTNSKSSEISSSSDISVGPRNSKFAITAASVSNIKVSLGCWIFLAGVRRPLKRLRIRKGLIYKVYKALPDLEALRNHSLFVKSVAVTEKHFCCNVLPKFYYDN
uniref:Uncharacterized protein n=1 Tax=Glossina austeni TaxID=7395 RepID=A0A1A9VA02_GLOAU